MLEHDVWGVGRNDLGFTRDGTHAEYLVVSEDGVALRPANLSAPDAAASALPYVTAWLALVERAQLKREEVALISGAAGSVGTAATVIATYIGAHSIALVKDASERDALDPRRVIAIAQSDAGDLAEVVRRTTNGRGCDVALNTVGAAIFPQLLAALASRGRMSVIAAAAGRVVEHFDLLDFYRRDLSLYGIDTGGANFTVIQAARILNELYAGFESGALTPICPTQTFPLAHAPQAYCQKQSPARTAWG